MKILSNWLNANKISLTVKKTETIIFKLRKKKYEGVIKPKLNRQRLHFSKNVKYLGIKIDEKLNWKHCINELSTKLIRANAILFKVELCQSKNTKVYLFGHKTPALPNIF